MDVTVKRSGEARFRAVSSFEPIASATVQRTNTPDVLLVDLNQFASFPTLAIGLLTAALRQRGHRVQVLCPLAYDVPGVQRERAETFKDYLSMRIRLSDSRLVVFARELSRAPREWRRNRPHPAILREISRQLTDGTDAILVSAYLNHSQAVRAIADLAAERGIPMILGGPMFNLPEVAAEWRRIPGVTAVVGGESELHVANLVEALIRGGEAAIARLPGVTLPSGSPQTPTPPLRPLNSVPFADFTDFPWDRYPVRIVPMMTGRGCQWDKCTFCSDVISASGRTFRTRSVENVLLEVEEQSRRHSTSNFLFIDLKLNSYPNMFRGLADGMRRHVRDAEWIGTVHVDMRKDNGLSRSDLAAAAKGGMRRINFGLESGSQRLLDAMRKGSSVEANSAFIRHAYEAGLSIRCSMFKGYPGETAEDMQLTARFLEAHAPYLDRIRFCDFSLPIGTPLHEALMRNGGSNDLMSVTANVGSRAFARYEWKEAKDRSYRRAKARLLRVVHEINRRPLRPSARQFDGLM
ncbi:radical SAM protein [Sulfitobacter sp. D35]|uniref:B12-binding domain-containing radical SAM protein n=1 Tax=Sulfitobacter sp. D35 TaxID=3083252 RepID=UPI00296E85D9|nr:radical SAM protein [Sulfitobacter sp. D35]MDW4500567.1 radical SAM protein [Sulfitobacter sp. D35]